MRNPRLIATLLIAAFLSSAGCKAGVKPTVPPGRNIATPDKMPGEGGLPPTPQK